MSQIEPQLLGMREWHVRRRSILRKAGLVLGALALTLYALYTWLAHRLPGHAEAGLVANGMGALGCVVLLACTLMAWAWLKENLYQIIR